MNLNKFLIFEPSLFPKNNRTSLLFPMDPNRTAQMHNDLASYDKNSKSIDLVYIGNQYGRDQSFSIYYNEASRLLGSPAEIYGKWTKTDQFPNVNFNCRVGFEQVHSIYTQAFANVIIAPERYYKTDNILNAYLNRYGDCAFLSFQKNTLSTKIYFQRSWSLIPQETYMKD